MNSYAGPPSRFTLNVLRTACLGLTLSTASLPQAGLVKIDPVTGNTGPACGVDGKCNPGVCNNDPDCPKLPDDLPPPTLRPAEDVPSSCGGTVRLEADDSALAVAAKTVRTRFPNLNAAQKSKNPKYFDSHPTGPLGTGHGELKGYGVTMIQGTRSNQVLNASGELTDPTELFFHKDGSNQDNWEIIGMGYAFSYERNGEATPVLSGIPSDAWLIHEAGYHHSPGDGRFTCATDDDLKQSAIDAGKKISSAPRFPWTHHWGILPPALREVFMAKSKAERGRFSSRKKMDVVLRVLRGDDLDMVSREAGITAATVSAWRDQFLASGQAGLKSRAGDGRDDELARLKALVGDLTMRLELSREAVQRLRGGTPLATGRSTR